MCGLTGYLSYGSLGPIDSVLDVLGRMAQAIRARGPDGQGIWTDVDAGIGLAHRRLAIVDLSPAGSQPMVSSGGRFVLAYNGEIYNHMTLRQALDGLAPSSLATMQPNWRGHSDTETLLAGFERWGVEATLGRTVGMFAFALWDRERRVLTLGRDRFGEKPMYFGWQGQGTQSAFVFGSDLSALRQHPSFEGNIDRNALALYMRHACIGGEHSIYQGIHKLLPGHCLEVSQAQPVPVVTSWWSAAEAALHGAAHPFIGSPEDAVGELERLLKRSVGQQMMADVPLGAFLSGGVDSSTVVALMQAQSSRPVKTFSIGFHEESYNEAAHAKAVAQHLGTDHTELYVTAQEAMGVIPKLPTLYSEPFADSSQIPTFLVSHLARQHVTVSLSGDAGDELFCGYSRYQTASRLWERLRRMPKPVRRAIATGITAIPSKNWDLAGRWLNMQRLGDKMRKGTALLSNESVADLYRDIVSHWPEPDSVVLGGREPSPGGRFDHAGLTGLGEVEHMMALDMIGYLPDDVLAKVDRAAMGASLETRVPMLDHRLVAFAWSLPLTVKLRQGVTKWPLREVLYRHVPRSLIERPKMGFGVPIGDWLRGPLRDWAEDLLAEKQLRNQGYLHVEIVRAIWLQHLTGRCDWTQRLWTVLMFQAWLKANG